MSTTAGASSRLAIRPLTRDEIDRRLDWLARDLSTAAVEARTSPSTGTEPRWISAAELVRRLRPFIASN